MLTKQICRMCHNRMFKIAKWDERDDKRWLRGVTFCPMLDDGSGMDDVADVYLDVVNDVAPDACPYHTEQVVAQDAPGG